MIVDLLEKCSATTCVCMLAFRLKSVPTWMSSAARATEIVFAGRHGIDQRFSRARAAGTGGLQ